MPASQDSIANETGELPSATENFRRGDYIAGRLNREPKAKRCIAQRVARLVKNNQSVLLDAGSTIEMVADELLREREYLAVLTNNLGAYARYADAKRRPKDANDDRTMSVLDNELHLTGGRYHETYESLSRAQHA